MGKALKGKKSYIVAALSVLLGIWGVASGVMLPLEALNYALGGGALAAVRDAIG